jgi:hypothetical protein
MVMLLSSGDRIKKGIHWQNRISLFCGLLKGKKTDFQNLFGKNWDCRKFPKCQSETLLHTIDRNLPT